MCIDIKGMKGDVFIKILSLDQAINKTGYCLFCNNEIYEYGLIDNSKTKNHEEKINKTYFEISKKIKTMRPDILVMEDVALQTSPKILIELSRLQGYIEAVCDSYGIKYILLKPTVWRKEIGIQQGKKIKRSELKESAINYIKLNYDKNVTSDEADSICIGISAISIMDKQNLKGGQL